MDASRLRRGEILFWESPNCSTWDWFNSVFKITGEGPAYNTFLSLHVNNMSKVITVELKKSFPVKHAAKPEKPKKSQIYKLIEKIFSYRIQERDYN